MSPSAAARAARVSQISDEELRAAHRSVKAKLAVNFGELRTAFRKLDKDFSGSVTRDEAALALEELNVGVRREVLGRILDLADYDGDGERQGRTWRTATRRAPSARCPADLAHHVWHR